ncbi:MAG: EAL domain-containing protein [Gammaproteobacteria bacterium]|nr:EAL domain-containing protein [Gammaproteobacteria bacterium]
MEQGKAFFSGVALAVGAGCLAGILLGWAGLVVAAAGLGLLWKPWAAHQAGLRERDARASEILRGERQIRHGSHQLSQPEWARAYDRLLEELAQANAEKHDLAEEIRSHSFEDRLTGLGNRHFFDSRFEVFARAPEEAAGGAVLLLQLCDPVELAGGDESGAEDLLKQAAVLLEGTVRDTENAVLARRGGADFALLVPQFPPNQLPALANKLLRALTGLVLPSGSDAQDLVHIGVSQYRAGDEPYAILAQADMALRTAQLQGPNSWYMHGEGALPSEQVRGSVRWRSLLEHALDKRQLVVHYQPVRSADGEEILHYEAFSRLKDEKGELIKAAVFLPMARSLGLAPQLDRLAVDLIVKQLMLGTEADTATCISINLSAESLTSNQFMIWLRTRLAEHPRLAARLMFELDEYAVARLGAELDQPLQYFRELGCRLCVDHVGLAITRSVYLAERHFDCVKLHSSIVRGIDEATPNQLFARSLHSLCVEGGMRLLAEGIETEAEWLMLKSLGVSGGQGYWLGEPGTAIA